MAYKAVFIDVDGTLLNDDLQIAEGTRDIIRKLNSENVLIAIVTGRSPASSLPYYEDLGIAGNPVVCYNGALIIRNGTILLEEMLQKEDCLRILTEAKDYNVNVSFYHQYDWFSERMDDWIKQENAISNTIITQRKLSELLEDNFNPNKILCMGHPEEITLFEDHLNAIGYPTLNIYKSKPTYLEVVNRNTSKAQGIKTLIDIYNIKEREIIAIGDNYNDIEMLEMAGTSVVMGNAPEEVKKYATLVTDTNNREGIKKALELLYGR
ncbi:MAG: Cof-type HAD-IIB family hydrolase [bacterium]|nr:Cof-type HAD-IIB family hydrolase [Synergistaceae bacterium]MDD2328229.1 Cof-type HAD-IIB family hydrolase [bacterium]MDD4459386.1 Cof-type HAD-IIB family hydrolase [Proteiniphilum sp.]